MTTPPFGLRTPHRYVSVWRVVGVRTWVVVALWSTVVLVGLGLLRDTAFLTQLGDAGRVDAAVGLLVADLPLPVLLFVVVLVTSVVVPVRYVRERSRAGGGARPARARATRRRTVSGPNVLLGAHKRDEHTARPPSTADDTDDVDDSRPTHTP